MTDLSITLEGFEALVKQHDLTYDYSDDHYVWRRGASQLASIKKAAKLFPRADVVRIWNANVDSYLVEGAREHFYWPDNWPCKEDV